MNPNLIVVLFTLILLGFVWADANDDADEISQQNENAEKVKKGIAIFRASLDKYLFGEPKGQGYTDLFLDTNYDLIESISKLPQHHTLEEYLPIFFQNLIILMGNKRADAIPLDFNDRHPAFGDFVKELQRLFDILASRGTRGITFKTLQKMFKTIKSDDFWMSLVDLDEETTKKIQSEKDKSEL